jgi:hypothetical protein
VDLWFDEDWARLHVLETRTANGTAWALIEHNRCLSGTTRYSLDPLGRLHLSADVPVTGIPDLPARLLSAWRGVSELCTRECRAAAAPPRPWTGLTGPLPGAAATPTTDLQALCDGLEWPISVRADGALTIALALPGESCQAALWPAGDAGVQAWLEVGLDPPRAPDRREALATLLLATSHAVRLARAAGGETAEGRARAGFEVRLEAPVEPAAVDHALHALRIAAGMCAREARLIVDEAVAAAFLARWTPHDITAPPQTS